MSRFVYCIGLFAATAASYGVSELVLRSLHLSRAAVELGEMWTAISAVFVLHVTRTATTRQAVVRLSATVVSVALTQIWLTFAHPTWYALAALVAASAAVLLVAGRPRDVVTACITTIVIVQAAAVSPTDAVAQPSLRLLDTALGTAVGLVMAIVLARMPARFVARGTGHDDHRRNDGGRPRAGSDE